MRSGLFVALCKEALWICPLRAVLQTKDARGLMLCFLARARKLLRAAMEQSVVRCYEAVQKRFFEILDAVDAVEAFARWDDVERLLALAPSLCHADRWLLRDLAGKLMGGREAMQLGAIISYGARMIKAVDSREGCWKYVYNHTCDRVWRVARLITTKSRILPYLHAECAGMSVREREEVLQELLYRRNALSRFGKVINL